MGAIDNPLHILSVAIGCEATFVARTVDINTKHVSMVLQRAAEHRGTSFVEVYQNCVVFNDGAFDYAADRDIKADTTLELEHGKPLIFGKNRDKGIRLNGLEPEVVTLGRAASAKKTCWCTTSRRRSPAWPTCSAACTHPIFPSRSACSARSIGRSTTSGSTPRWRRPSGPRAWATCRKCSPRGRPGWWGERGIAQGCFFLRHRPFAILSLIQLETRSLGWECEVCRRFSYGT